MFPKQFLLYALEQSRDGTAFINMDGRIDYVNAAWTEMHGYEEQELIGYSASIFYEEKSWAEQWDQVVRSLQDTNYHEMEIDHKKKDGTLFRAWITVNMLWDQEGRPVGYLATARDITERQQLEESLRSANQRLREQAEDLAARNTDLDAFSHSVAHDLKNLLTSVLGYSEMLLDDYDAISPANRVLFLERIHQYGSTMQRVIDNLLLLARLRRSEFVPVLVDMGAPALSALNRLEESVRHSGAQITLPEDWPAVLGHGPWIENVWENYLSNALKYGGAPPQIQIRWCRQEDGFIRFYVTDNGPGIAPQDQSRLFLPFSRLGASKAVGHGLGLSIVRRIVEKCGGRVGVESAPNQGSHFWFDLPSAEAAESA